MDKTRLIKFFTRLETFTFIKDFATIFCRFGFGASTIQETTTTF